MTEALYRKYRPSTFDDVVGQEHIERTLKNALEHGKVSHAYLFCGPRGTGKTTMARILAKALLCKKAPTTEPDGTCEECMAIAAGTHPDVYELDAASRTGVENVREEIINRVHYAPTQGSCKIYIIDEVHMLSTAAFNALLKTLEEPPGHVVFILCTTDPQKVPDTIHSRCQRFDFHRLSVDEIVARLGAVCGQEGMEFEPEALELIAHQAEGGMRNALTSLEQLAAFGEGKVTLDGAHRILGSLDDEGLSEIVQALGRRDAAACFTWVSRYVETGADIAQFVQDLAEYVRNLYLLSLTDAEAEIPVSASMRASMVSELELFGTERLSRALGVLGDLMKELRATTNSRLAFEIALTRLLRPEADLTMEALAERLEELERKMRSMPAAAAAAGAATAAQPASASVPQRAPMRPAPAPQPMPSPSPAPAPQPVPAPAPGSASIPQQASAARPVPADQPPSAVRPAPQPVQPGAPTAAPASQHAARVPAPGPSAAAVPAASFDHTNAAALQRMWHQVTTTLRKVNPARGVLFMGAKIEPSAQGDGVRIVFSPDSSFAYAAAQKKEVKDLLAQTFVDVTGGSVSFQLVMGQGQQGGSSRSAAASQPANAQPVSAAVQPSVPRPAQPMNAQPAYATPQPTANAQAPAVSSQPSQPVSAPSSSSAMSRYDDESPFVEDDIPIAEMVSSAPVPALSNPSQGGPGYAVAAVAAPTAPTGPVSPVVAPQGMPAPAPASVPGQDEAAAEAAMSESDQIKQILTASFGDGVKFDTM